MKTSAEAALAATLEVRHIDIKEVESRIAEAIKEGKFNISLSFSRQGGGLAPIKETLLENGYRVTTPYDGVLNVTW